jgi:hypothetical protein
MNDNDTIMLIPYNLDEFNNYKYCNMYNLKISKIYRYIYILLNFNIIVIRMGMDMFVYNCYFLI